MTQEHRNTNHISIRSTLGIIHALLLTIVIN